VSKACTTELSEKQLVNKFTVAVLASGNGSNLQAIIDKLHRRPVDETVQYDDPDHLVQARVPIVEVAIVISDQPNARAIQRAWTAGIPTAVIPFDRYDTRAAHDEHMAAAINDVDVDLVILAGYMRMLEPAFVEAFAGKLINIHPALLPAFPGTHGIEDALAYGVKVTGVTVHYVNEQMDSGPVIAQEAVLVEEGDTAQSLATRIHAVEHELLPRTIRMIAAGKVQPPSPGSRRVRFSL
jgi:phosphoribosylglycinamide formyltransferase 1